MAGRSFLRRLLGNRSDAAGLDDVSTAPTPGGFAPVPYPNTTDGDGPPAVARSTGPEDRPDGTTQPELAGQRFAADAERTSFDEADAIFGTRTEVPEAKEVAPTELTPTVDAGRSVRDGFTEMNGITGPDEVVADRDDGDRTVTQSIYDGLFEQTSEGTYEGFSTESSAVPPQTGESTATHPDQALDDPIIEIANEKTDEVKFPGPEGQLELEEELQDKSSDPDEGIVGRNEIVPPNNVAEASDDGARALISDDRTAEGIIGPNHVVDGTDGSIAGQGLLSPTSVAADPIDGVVVRDPDGNFVASTKAELQTTTSESATVSKGDPESVLAFTSNSDHDDGAVGQNGIVSPHNVVADPDDDLVLADLSGGSIGDQLTANAGFSSDATDLGLTDDLDDLDDAGVD